MFLSRCLSPDILKEETVEFAEEKGIQIYTVDMLESKEPFIGISNKAVTHALEVLSGMLLCAGVGASRLILEIILAGFMPWSS